MSNTANATTVGLGEYDIIEVRKDDHEVVNIAPNYGNGGYIAVHEIAGSALRSKSFKTLAGATRWAKRVMA